MSPAGGTPPPASHSAGRRVAVITGASGGIGAGLVAAFRHAGYSVVATSLSIGPFDDDDILAVQVTSPKPGPLRGW
jgi:NAD(P)-dependent dehydrogenase (short-subunit alcohol dehydrogenase family)